MKKFNQCVSYGSMIRAVAKASEKMPEGLILEILESRRIN